MHDNLLKQPAPAPLVARGDEKLSYLIRVGAEHTEPLFGVYAGFDAAGRLCACALGCALYARGLLDARPGNVVVLPVLDKEPCSIEDHNRALAVAVSSSIPLDGLETLPRFPDPIQQALDARPIPPDTLWQAVVVMNDHLGMAREEIALVLEQMGF